MIERPSRSAFAGRKFLDIQQARRDAILQLLDEGWKRASECPAVNPAAGEVENAEHLRDSMREVVNGDVASWAKNVWVLLGTESRSMPSARRPDG